MFERWRHPTHESEVPCCRWKESSWNEAYHLPMYICTICVLILYSIWFTTCTLQRKSHKSRQTKKKHGCLLQMRFLFDVSGPLGLVAWASLAQGVCLSAILATRDAVTPLKVVCTAAVPGDERIEGMGYERLDLTIKSWIEVWRHYHNIIIFNLQSIKIKKIESVW